MSISNEVTSLVPFIRGIIRDLEHIDGRDGFEFLGDNLFTLTQSFINESSIRVYVNGVELDEDDWDFDSDRNQLIIDFDSSSEDLNEGDNIIITYSYYKNHSDAEIIQYVNSSFSYFAEFKYKKVFELNEDNEIVCENDVDPTTKELYFICLITAIIIDPQNVEIDVDGVLKITANREKSDHDQIKDAFNNINRFIGEITFNKIDPDCEC